MAGSPDFNLQYGSDAQLRSLDHSDNKHSTMSMNSLTCIVTAGFSVPALSESRVQQTDGHFISPR